MTKRSASSRKHRKKSRDAAAESSRERRNAATRRRLDARGTPRVGSESISALREAIAFERGENTGAVFRRAPIHVAEVRMPAAPAYSAADVVRIRRQFGVSQAVFAMVLNVSRATVRSWEQGLKAPSGASVRLLEIADRDPDVLLRNVQPVAS